MADQSGYWPNNNSGTSPYLYPQSPLTGATPTTGAPTTGSTSVTDQNDPPADTAGAWAGVKTHNKYAQSTATDDGGEIGDPQADAALQATGLPHYTGSQLQQASSQVAGDPQFQQLSQTMMGIAKNPQTAQAQAGNLVSTAANVSQDKNINVWELLIIAFKGCVKDQNDQMQYDLSKLQMYSDMNTQMSQYGEVLEKAQQALDTKQHEHSSQSNVQVEMDDQREYNNFNTLDSNGNLHYQQDATQANGAASSPEDLINLGSAGNGGNKYQVPNSTMAPFTGYGADEGAQRLNAWNQLQDQGSNAKQGDSNNLVSAQGLNMKVQNYTNQMDQLQKQITKWQNQYQSDSETKNQLIATVTSILKNMYDMQSNGTRNLSM